MYFKEKRGTCRRQKYRIFSFCSGQAQSEQPSSKATELNGCKKLFMILTFTSQRQLMLIMLVMMLFMTRPYYRIQMYLCWCRSCDFMIFMMMKKLMSLMILSTYLVLPLMSFLWVLHSVALHRQRVCLWSWWWWCWRSGCSWCWRSGCSWCWGWSWSICLRRRCSWFWRSGCSWW